MREVFVDDDLRQATVIVPDDQLSLAIGREGQNARLAARLTGWRIDIRSETEFAGEPDTGDYEEQDTGGRCGAVMTTGRRCPNATLPSSRYCGLPAHQALTRFGTSSLLVIQGLDDAEVAVLADPAAGDDDVAALVAKGEAHAAEHEAQATADAAAAEAVAAAAAEAEADADLADAGELGADVEAPEVAVSADASGDPDSGGGAEEPDA